MATKLKAKRRAMAKSAKTHRTKAPRSAAAPKLDRSTIQALARRIRDAYASGVPCPPVRNDLKPGDIDAAYAIQRANTDFWLKAGRRLVGRKIGLTAKTVQRQLGVDQPDYGMLFADMMIGDGEDIPLDRALQPRVEAEVALVLERDLTHEQPTVADVIMATAYAVPSIEVVGSRIANWDIKIQDTIADNASGALFVLGGPPRRLEEPLQVRPRLRLPGDHAQGGQGHRRRGNLLRGPGPRQARQVVHGARLAHGLRGPRLHDR